MNQQDRNAIRSLFALLGSLTGLTAVVANFAARKIKQSIAEGAVDTGAAVAAESLGLAASIMAGIFGVIATLVTFMEGTTSEPTPPDASIPSEQDAGASDGAQSSLDPPISRPDN